MPYTNSLTDREWEIIEPLLLQKKRTRPPKWSKREITAGILYQLKNVFNWVNLPKDLSPYSIVVWYYKQWCKDDVFDTIMATLHDQVRAQVKKRQWTTLNLIDSPAVKNTCNASAKSKGFRSYKSTKGFKRQLAVVTLSFLVFTHCKKANLSEDQGLIEMLTKHLDYFLPKPMNISKSRFCWIVDIFLKS